MKILVTGAAGFIGYHLMKAIQSNTELLVGLDNFNDYYDVNLKYDRVRQLGIDIELLNSETILKSSLYSNILFIKEDLNNYDGLVKIFNEYNFDIVINLAAQAGVRYSITNPQAYLNSNVIGFFNILECSRTYNIKHLIYASSSSVYGNNTKVPFSVDDNVDHPISFYAATKKCNELMAHTYSHLHSLKTTGLRFFTVYGPWGRPDMAYFSFIKNIYDGTPINVFNNGDLYRDFTFIDDIIESLRRIIFLDDSSNSLNSNYELFNIGNSAPIKLMDFIQCIETEIGISANKNFVEMQQGDVFATFADVTALEDKISYKPKTQINDGIKLFVDWFRNYYNK